MTDKQRIADLERRIAELERRPQYVVITGPYWITPPLPQWPPSYTTVTC